MFQAIKKILLEPEENSWKLSGTTATYKSSYKTAGYTLASNGKSITYAKATTAEGLATIKGAKSKSFTVSGKKITLKNSALNKKVLISGGYEFSFAFDYKKATITSSASGEGSDVFIYNRSDGNDIITDYAEEDKISIASGTIGTVKKSGFNVIFTVGSNKITVKSAASKTVTCIDKNGKVNLILGGY